MFGGVLRLSAVQLVVVNWRYEAVENGGDEHPEVTGVLKPADKELVSFLREFVMVLISKKMPKGIKILRLMFV